MFFEEILFQNGTLISFDNGWYSINMDAGQSMKAISTAKTILENPIAHSGVAVRLAKRLTSLAANPSVSKDDLYSAAHELLEKIAC